VPNLLLSCARLMLYNCIGLLCVWGLGSLSHCVMRSVGAPTQLQLHLRETSTLEAEVHIFVLWNVRFKWPKYAYWCSRTFKRHQWKRSKRNWQSSSGHLNKLRSAWDTAVSKIRRLHVNRYAFTNQTKRRDILFYLLLHNMNVEVIKWKIDGR
jgi:hypothetical protein